MSDTNEQATPQNDTQTTDSSPQIPDTAQGQASSEATFTQNELNKHAGERALRAKEAERKRILEELGIEDVDSAKALLDESRKRKEAEMSELEKADAKIAEANRKAQEAEQKLQAMQEQMLANKRKQAFLSAVRDSGGQNVDDLFILVQAGMSDDFLKVFDDNAEPNTALMEKFIKQIQASKPAYFGTASAGSPSVNNGVAPNAHDYMQEQQATIRNRIKRTF